MKKYKNIIINITIGLALLFTLSSVYCVINRISLDFNNAPIVSILQLIAKASMAIMLVLALFMFFEGIS